MSLSPRHPEPRFHPEVFAAIEALALPEPDEVVVTHGAALAAYGLRETYSDIDLIASLENVQYLRESLGFLVVRNIIGIRPDGQSQVILSTRGRHDGSELDVWRWDFSRDAYGRTGKGRIMPRDIPTTVHQPSGIRVASLEHLLAVKTPPRPGTRDAADIAAIRAALAKTT